MGRLGYYTAAAVIPPTLYYIAHAIKRRISANVVSEEFASDTKDFTFDLYNKIVDGNKDSNVVISPFSIHTALALAYTGASNETASEIGQSLRLPSNLNNVRSSFKSLLRYNDKEKVKIGTKIIIQDEFEVRSEFRTLAKNYFKSKVENIDFNQTDRADVRINGWVAYKTKGKLRHIIDTKSIADAKAILVNFAYFNDKWEYGFDKRQIAMGTFWLNENDSKQVLMMDGQVHGQVQHYGDSHTALILPYSSRNSKKYFMLIVVPKLKNGLRPLEESLVNDSSFKSEAFKIDKFAHKHIFLKIPRFQIIFSAELGPVLEKMGITRIFTDEADFSNIARSDNLPISKFVHKAYLKVDENGGHHIPEMMTDSQPQTITIDRPFLYFIIDRFGNIYFMGRVVDPTIE